MHTPYWIRVWQGFCSEKNAMFFCDAIWCMFQFTGGLRQWRTDKTIGAAGGRLHTTVTMNLHVHVYSAIPYSASQLRLVH